VLRPGSALEGKCHVVKDSSRRVIDGGAEGALEHHRQQLGWIDTRRTGKEKQWQLVKHWSPLQR
jgi:hypothetical protein